MTQPKIVTKQQNPPRETGITKQFHFCFTSKAFTERYMLLERLLTEKIQNDEKRQQYRSKSDKEKLVHTEIQSR